MKGVIRDTGLDHLTRLLFKRDLAFPLHHSTWWQRCYNGTAPRNSSREATVGSGPPQKEYMIEKESVQRPCNDTHDGLERGVGEHVVGWYGPDDPEVLL